MQVGLSAYLDENDQNLKESIVMKRALPRQILTSEEADTINGLRVGITTTVVSVSTFQLILSIALKTSLKQLWGMLNSQQVIAYMPMLDDLKFPGNAMEMNKYIIKIATFDLIPSDLIDE